MACACERASNLDNSTSKNGGDTSALCEQGVVMKRQQKMLSRVFMGIKGKRKPSSSE